MLEEGRKCSWPHAPSTMQSSPKLSNVLHSTRYWRDPHFGPGKDTIPSFSSREGPIVKKERCCYADGYHDAHVIVHLGDVVPPGSII
ncbi:hypothetical protein TTRE_0000870301 [Trichuris trichiura]|uniref:Uncharacterized protein n=1 Tax=Trichuris trichiura TaxID=36087 RepID=A0A077ZNR6_TRITR|nr:hypothetical protein TTRE_0000870301 [Trichuris trichiura]